MSSQREPRRWHLGDERLPGQLRQAIRAARSDLPSSGLLQSMAKGVAGRLLASCAQGGAQDGVTSVRHANHSSKPTPAGGPSMGSGSSGSCWTAEDELALDALDASDDGVRGRPTEERSSIRRRARPKLPADAIAAPLRRTR